MNYNLNSFETNPVFKHTKYAGGNCSYLVRKAAAFLFEIESSDLIV